MTGSIAALDPIYWGVESDIPTYEECKRAGRDFGYSWHTSRLQYGSKDISNVGDIDIEEIDEELQFIKEKYGDCIVY